MAIFHPTQGEREGFNFAKAKDYLCERIFILSKNPLTMKPVGFSMQELLFWGNQLVAFSKSPFYLKFIFITFWVFLCWLLTSSFLFTSTHGFLKRMQKYRKNVPWPTETGRTELNVQNDKAKENKTKQE